MNNEVKVAENYVFALLSSHGEMDVIGFYSPKRVDPAAFAFCLLYQAIFGIQANCPALR